MSLKGRPSGARKLFIRGDGLGAGAERLAYMEALLAPMQKYLHELDEDQAEAESASTTIDRAVD